MTDRGRPFEERIASLVKAWQRGHLPGTMVIETILRSADFRTCEELLALLPESFQDFLKEFLNKTSGSPWDCLRDGLIPFADIGLPHPTEEPTDVFWEHYARGTTRDSERFRYWLWKLRGYYAAHGLRLGREELPPLTLSLEEIMRLRETQSAESRLSELVAVHVLGWRKTKHGWEQEASVDGNMQWAECSPPHFDIIGKSDHLTHSLWAKLNSFHPWVIRDRKGTALRWAHVSMTEFMRRDYDFESGFGMPTEPSVIVIRDEDGPMIPRHRRPLPYDAHLFCTWDNGFTLDVDDLCSAVRQGRNFRIPGLTEQEALCRALLFAKKCRQDDSTVGLPGIE